MKKDRLKEFMLENQEHFDDQEVPSGLWDAIEKAVPKDPVRKTIPFWKYTWRAAAAILIFASAWTLHDYLDARKSEKMPQSAAAVQIQNPVLNELSDAEAYYTSQINSRQAELIKYTRENPEIMEDLKQEFKEFDQKNVQLKKELVESNADQKVIEAIIQSYRIKLAILEQLLEEINKNKKTHPNKSVNL